MYGSNNKLENENVQQTHTLRINVKHPHYSLLRVNYFRISKITSIQNPRL